MFCTIIADIIQTISVDFFFIVPVHLNKLDLSWIENKLSRIYNTLPLTKRSIQKIIFLISLWKYSAGIY